MNSFTGYNYETKAIPSPCYVVEEELLRRNLQLISSIAHRAGVEIIMAFKAFALWHLFPVTRQYIPCSTASSLYEARLATEYLGAKAHTFAPVYRDDEFEQTAACSSHITFNSITQYQRHAKAAHAHGVSCGLRINPEYSDVATALYNPCAPGSRFGITTDQLPNPLPDGIEGLHFHTLCESTSYDLAKTLKIVESRFAPFLDQVKWLNMGGGHLMTRADYDTEHLIDVLQQFNVRHPNLHIILEPGSAHTWRTGVLVSTVLDIVANHGIKTAILDVSFACHMPDCLEMPYQPNIIGATIEPADGKYAYRMGGNSCLSGDFIGNWYFDKPLQVGQRIVFEDMNHYTNVKTTMFNGITHPSLAVRRTNGSIEILREYTFEDYLRRNG